MTTCTKLSTSEPSIGEQESKASESRGAIEISTIGDVSEISYGENVSDGRGKSGKSAVQTRDTSSSPLSSSGDFISSIVDSAINLSTTRNIPAEYGVSGVEDYQWDNEEFEPPLGGRGVEVLYEISDDIHSDSDKNVETCASLTSWREKVEDKNLDSPPKSASPECEEDIKGCEVCYRKAKALQQLARSNGNDTDLAEDLRFCVHHSRDPDGLDELDDQVLRRWLENKMYYNDIEGLDSDKDETDEGNKESPTRSRNSKDDDDENESPTHDIESASQWFHEDSAFEFISQVSRLTQTDDSYLQFLNPTPDVDEGQERIAAGSDCIREPQEDSPVIPNEEEDHEVADDGDDKSSSEGENCNDLNSSMETQINENFEMLLDSIHQIPPMKSEDGSCNMWMLPAQDENSNCMNIVLDDGEVYDIFVFRPGGPATSASTQTDEHEFIEPESV